MNSGKKLAVYTNDGVSVGYFLNGRLYEYATSNCVGFVDDGNRFISQSQIAGHLKGSRLIKNDGTTLNIPLAG